MRFVSRYGYRVLIILTLSVLFLPFSAWSQFQQPFFTPGFYNPLFAPQTTQTVSTITLIREFPAGQNNQEHVSFLMKTSSLMSIILDISSQGGQLFRIEMIPENTDNPSVTQGNRILVPVGSEKIDGAWHEWLLNDMDDVLEGMGVQFGFIARVEIHGEDFCMGPAIAFFEEDGERVETSYLASFTEEREAIADYGWVSITPVTCEYHDGDGDEGYVCLDPSRSTQQQFPKIPVSSFIGPQFMPGPLLPVTLFTPASSGALPFAYPFGVPSLRLPSQLYSTPINPGLAANLLRSIPLYLDAQTGTPYSIGQNLLQFYDQIPTYPFERNYANDPAYAYLGLNEAPVTESFIPRPYYQ
ncbi:MAG: hypothetical protein ACMUIS_06160 [bacterium]